MLPGPSQSRTLLTNTNKELKVIANRYEIVKKLGSGSFGTVYLSADLKSNEELKVLKQIYVGDMRPNETISAVNEAKLLAKLEHPGIVKFHDSFINASYLYIVTEYCEGGDLDQKLHSWKKQGRYIDKELLLAWFVQLLLAVQYIHQRRVLHRDLKTRNIFIKNNMIKIGDFGISRILVGTSDIATTFTGTPYFMSPEILRQEGYNSKSDIWSIGVILYEMCTLKRAFQGDNLMSIMFNIVEGHPPILPDQYGKELKSIYERMLCKDPAWRSSALEILNDSFIQHHLEKLKLDLTHNLKDGKTLVKREAAEIANALKKTKGIVNLDAKVQSHRPVTPKQKLLQKKQKQADLNAEKMKKVTACAYAENHSRYRYLRQRQKKVTVPLLLNDENPSVSLKENSHQGYDLETEWLKSINLNARDTNDDITTPVHKYTHCFGEDDETFCPSFYSEDKNKLLYHEEITDIHELKPCENRKKKRDCTEIYVDGSYKISYGTNTSATNINDIPDDPTFADTYYSSYADFEEASSESEADSSHDGGDYTALVNCMENVLLNSSATDHTFSETVLVSTTMRQQKIQLLRSECVRLFGEDGFQMVYQYLAKVRFGTSSKSEEEIMYRLKKLVNNTRDCFLVDQLLFLEKQDQISLQNL